MLPGKLRKQGLYLTHAVQSRGRRFRKATCGKGQEGELFPWVLFCVLLQLALPTDQRNLCHFEKELHNSVPNGWRQCRAAARGQGLVEI